MLMLMPLLLLPHRRPLQGRGEEAEEAVAISILVTKRRELL